MQNVVLLVQFFTGLILMVLSFIMGLINSTTHLNSLLKVGRPKVFLSELLYYVICLGSYGFSFRCEGHPLERFVEFI